MLRFAVCVLALSVAVPEVVPPRPWPLRHRRRKKEAKEKEANFIQEKTHCCKEEKAQNEQTPLCTPPGSADPLDER